MTKYCLSCGAPNSGAATVCSRCGKVIGNKGVTPPPIYDLHGFQNFKGSVTQKCQEWSIVMLVFAGIELLWGIIREGMLVTSSDIISIVISIIISIIMNIHCSSLLRRMEIRKKGAFIFYEIVFGLDAITRFCGVAFIFSEPKEIMSSGQVSYFDLLYAIIRLAFSVITVVMLYLKSSRRTV